MRTLLLAINEIGSLRLQEKVKLYAFYKTKENFLNTDFFELQWLLGRSLRIKTFSPSKLIEKALEIERQCRKKGIFFVSFLQTLYPPLLKEIYDPPFILFYRGTLPNNKRETLAVVGTRKPSLEAQRASFSLGVEAAHFKMDLISGLALGVDSLAHRGVLENGGRTWAVLATGCDQIYPSSHRSLALKMIQKGGGLLSEFIPGTKPVRYNFPKRNRIISGLSHRVIIVEAPKRSGALYTADFALDQGRDVLVHHCGTSSQIHCEGSAKLAEEGAEVLKSLGTLSYRLKGFLCLSIKQKDPLGETVGAKIGTSLSRELKGKTLFFKGRSIALG